MPAVALAAEKIGFSARLAMAGEPRFRQVVATTAVILRRKFRASGLRIKPISMA